MSLWTKGCGKLCEICGAALSGKQRRYCSRTCRQRGYEAGKGLGNGETFAGRRVGKRHGKAKPKSAPSKAPRQRDHLAEAEAARLRMRRHREAQAELEAQERQQTVEEVTEAALSQDIVAWCADHCRPSMSENWQPPGYIRDLLALAENAPKTLRAVFLRKGCRLGWTQATTAIMCRFLLLGRDVVAFQPRTTDATSYRRDTVQPAMERCAPLQQLEAHAKRTESSASHKVLPNGGTFLLSGGKGGAAWRRWTADLLVIDEYDGFPGLIGDGDGEGTLAVMGRRGLQTRRGRLLGAGTPSDALGPSRITDEALSAEVQMLFAFACPHCGELDYLLWERLTWPRDDVKGVTHTCRHCHTKSPQSVVMAALERSGKWAQCEMTDSKDRWPTLRGDLWLDGATLMRGTDAVPESEWPDSLGLHLWSAYSPWMDWCDLVRLWLSSKGDPIKRRGFLEQYLARPDQGQVEVASESAVRAMRKPVTEFDGGVSVIVGADVQQWGVSLLVCGFTRPERVVMWERVELKGVIDTVGAGVWPKLLQWLQESCWPVSGELPRPADWLAIDVGFQQSVVMDATQWIADRVPVQVRWCKGTDGWSGAELKLAQKTLDGRRPWIIKTWPVKESVMGKLTRGEIVVSDRITDEVVHELCGEELRRGLSRGKTTHRWVQRAEHVEALDCLVYATGTWRSIVGRPADLFADGG